MIGNDVVDLAQAAKDSNWRRPRFLDRIFTAQEQESISNSNNKDQTVWLLWSLKEAAYKAYVQETGHKFFNPKKLRCQIMSSTEGIVEISKRMYRTTSRLTEDFIHSIASTEAHEQNLNACFPLSKTDHGFQSEAVRSVLIETLSKDKSFRSTNLQVRTDDLGIPSLYSEDIRLSKRLSFSHHGAYGAFVIS
jgi:phosphopantetheine--protein transferase-like protein